MGWSCSAAAAETLRAITALVGSACSNALPCGGFWEVGAERADGAIVGMCHPKVGRPCGFRIEPDGMIARFPGIPIGMRRDAQFLSMRRHAALVARGTWRDRARALLTLLEAGEDIDPLLWTQFEAILSGYQSEKRIMFLAYPAFRHGPVCDALRAILSEEGP